jgi:tRNA nucleotidyltransferase/poly(A) polymerase
MKLQFSNTPLLQSIGKIADEENIRAFVVGGFVRDVLMERKREHFDIDIVVVSDGVAFAKKVAHHFGRKNIVTFEKFGTAQLILDDTKIEFVGSRKEAYERNSRKPFVEIGTIEDDVARRDFTMNAIASSLNAETFGTILDPFNGRNAIEKQIIQTPLEPEMTFSDDPLRMMRAIRFASQLGFFIEEKTLHAIYEMRERISIISQERITDEFFKILSSPKPSVGLKLLHQTRLLEFIFPEVAQMVGQEQRKDFHHKDVFFHTLKVVDNIAKSSENVWLRFTGLMHDIAKPRTKAFEENIGWTFHGHEEIGARMQKRIFKKLRLPLEHLPYVEKLVRLHLRPMVLVKEEVTDAAIRRLLFECGEDTDDLMLLCRADITSQNPARVAEYLNNYDVVMEKMKEVEERDRLRAWRPPVMGEEIMRVCNIPPGKLVGKLKTMIEEEILEGRIPNEHDAALYFLLSVKDEVISCTPIV